MEERRIRWTRYRLVQVGSVRGRSWGFRQGHVGSRRHSAASDVGRGTWSYHRGGEFGVCVWGWLLRLTIISCNYHGRLEDPKTREAGLQLALDLMFCVLGSTRSFRRHRPILSPPPETTRMHDSAMEHHTILYHHDGSPIDTNPTSLHLQLFSPGGRSGHPVLA